MTTKAFQITQYAKIKQYHQDLYSLYGPEKNCLRGLTNNKGADQPVHLRSLISAFAICLLESIISRLATSNISIF